MKARGIRRDTVPSQEEKRAPAEPQVSAEAQGPIKEQPSAEQDTQSPIPTTAMNHEEDPPADCPADRACCKSCSAYQDGKCMALFDVHFDNNVCPFYKERTQAARQHIAAMERLEDLGRDDLIRKYYRNHARFERILAEELVGIGYGFESDAATGSTSEASTPETSAAGDIASKDNTPEPNATEESMVEDGGHRRSKSDRESIAG